MAFFGTISRKAQQLGLPRRLLRISLICEGTEIRLRAKLKQFKNILLVLTIRFGFQSETVTIGKYDAYKIEKVEKLKNERSCSRGWTWVNYCSTSYRWCDQKFAFKNLINVVAYIKNAEYLNNITLFGQKSEIPVEKIIRDIWIQGGFRNMKFNSPLGSSCWNCFYKLVWTLFLFMEKKPSRFDDSFSYVLYRSWNVLKISTALIENEEELIPL